MKITILILLNLVAINITNIVASEKLGTFGLTPLILTAGVRKLQVTREGKLLTGEIKKGDDIILEIGHKYSHYQFAAPVNNSRFINAEKNLMVAKAWMNLAEKDSDYANLLPSFIAHNLQAKIDKQSAELIEPTSSSELLLIKKDKVLLGGIRDINVALRAHMGDLAIRELYDTYKSDLARLECQEQATAANIIRKAYKKHAIKRS